ncbi:ankyrin repeat domain-containing protein [Burkholderia gladioli]|uniref:ankyrin repeat domain-containing protein n=1 Tax=Burkholderia gladioli TaxID=28095 RepID=UPI00164047CF|nr:ankyrin repeat domain-containing protein [Burkholderia gladioli]
MDQTDSTPNLSDLRKAIRTGNLTAIDDLIRSGTDINVPLPAPFENEDRYTPLMEAVVVGHPGTVKALLERGADVHGTDAHGRMALHVAAVMASQPADFDDLWKHQVEIAGILLDAGADVNASGDECFRPLLYAVRLSNPRLVRFLVERGAWLYKDQGHPASESGFVRHCRDRWKASLNDNPDVRPWDETLAVLDELGPVHGIGTVRPAIEHAIRRGDVEAVRALISKGIDINAPIAPDVGTPLTHAVACGNPDVVAALLALGANPSGRNEQGRTPLHLAIMRASSDRLHERALDVAKVLLDGGARIDEAQDGTGYRAIHFAAGHSNPRAIRWLVERGASVGADQDAEGSESSVLRDRRDRLNKPLQDNPDVRPWEQTLVLLDALAKAPNTVKA